MFLPELEPRHPWSSPVSVWFSGGGAPRGAALCGEEPGAALPAELSPGVIFPQEFQRCLNSSDDDGGEM